MAVTDTKIRHVSALLILLWALTPSSGMAAGLQSHASILEAARKHVLDQSGYFPAPPEVVVGRLDRRLRLKECDQPLESYTPNEKLKIGNTTVGVRCNGSSPWSLFVPVTVKVMAEIVVANRNMPRGSIIGQGDLTLEKRDLARLHRGYMEDATSAIGKKLRNRVRKHQVITPSQLDVPLAVKRNNRVIIQASNSTIQIRMVGKALENGGIGETIRVRNISSNKEIDAKIISSGIVEVSM
jgi:flagella basal body P-ring formation protein FlgA